MSEQTTKKLEQLAENQLDFANAMEAAAVKLQREAKDFLGSLETTMTEKPLEQRMKEAKDLKLNLAQPEMTKRDLSALPFDQSKINWTKAVGKKGAYELADESSNNENSDFKALVHFLEDVRSIPSGGCWLWLFDDLPARVGRKPLAEIHKGKSIEQKKETSH